MFILSERSHNARISEGVRGKEEWGREGGLGMFDIKHFWMRLIAYDNQIHKLTFLWTDIVLLSIVKSAIS